MLGLALLLVVAAAGYAFAQWRRLAPIPVLLILGILFSISGLSPERETALRFVELGLAFLVFNAGIELNPRRFLHQTSQVVWVGLGQFVLVGFAGFNLAGWMGFDRTASLYLGFAAAASSTLVVIRQLRAMQQMYQPFGRLVTGVLLLQDALAIAAIVGLSRVDAGGVAIASGLGSLLLLSLLAVVAHLWIVRWLEKVLRPDEETLLLLALATLFVFLGCADLLGLPIIAGAFLAGFTLSVFPLNGLLRGLLSSLTEFFQAIFFTALGSLVLFSSWWMPLQALLFAMLVLIVTPIVVTMLAEWQGQSSRNSLESGLLLAQTSELSLVIGLVGVASGHLDASTFSMITLTAAFTMIVTPFLASDRVTWSLLHYHPGRRSGGFAGFEDHVLLIGFGGTGMWVFKDLVKAGQRVLVIDEDTAVIAHCEKNRIPCLRGDGTDPRLLSRAGLSEARAVLINMPRIPDSLKIVQQVQGKPVIVRVFEDADAEKVRQAGAIPVSSAEATLKRFLGWLDSGSLEHDKRGHFVNIKSHSTPRM